MRGRGSGKRLVSLFLGCALIVVGLIGPQVVGRADGATLNGKFQESGSDVTEVTKESSDITITYEGTVSGDDADNVERIENVKLVKDSDAIDANDPSYEKTQKKLTASFTISATTKAETYTLSVAGKDSSGGDITITCANTLKVKDTPTATPTLQSISLKGGKTNYYPGDKIELDIVVKDISTTESTRCTVEFKNDDASDTQTFNIIGAGTSDTEGVKYSLELDIPDTPRSNPQEYKLSSITIDSKPVGLDDKTISFNINPAEIPILTVFTTGPDASSSVVIKGDTIVQGTFKGKIENLGATVPSAKATFSDGINTLETEQFDIEDKHIFTPKFNVPSDTPNGTYKLTAISGVTGLVITDDTYSFVVRDADSPVLKAIENLKTGSYESGDKVKFNAKFEKIKLTEGKATIKGKLTFQNEHDSSDRVVVNFASGDNVVTNETWTLENIETAAIINSSGSDKTYKLVGVENTSGLEGVTLDAGTVEFKVKSGSTPSNPTLNSINLTSEVLPNGIVYFSGKVSPKPSGDTISAKFVPGGVEANAINFSTGISSDGSFSGQIPLSGVAVGSEYLLTSVQVGGTTVTWTGQYMFRVVNSVSTPTLSTLAIGTPYTTSGTTTIPLSATIASAGTTGGVANTIKYIEIDYAIDTTTPAKATLYTTSNTSTLFTGSVARQFTNGSSHTITLSRARVYYQAGSDTSGNKVKEYDSLTGLITNNPLRFTVSNYTPSPVNPVNPVDPSNPSTPTNNTAVNQRAANTIIAMANNGSATLDYTSSPTVSANIFDLLRGTQKTVNLLAPGGFIWTFNGATVTGASKQIDLRVTATTLAATGATNSFPLVASLTGNRPVVILNFANNGVLPGTATITIPVSQHTSYIGTSNIYQYFVNESTRRLEKVGGPVTVSSGNTVTMAINHNSTYILTYGEVAGATASTTPTNNASDVLPIYNANATPTVTTPTNTTPTAGTTVNTVYRPGSTSPKTGDAFRMYVWVGMLLIGSFLVFASVLWPKKKEKSA